MSGLLLVQGLGRATGCIATHHHEPQPSRFVWHHVLPQVAGGKTIVSNLASLCDNCHYAVHALLYEMANDKPYDHRAPQGQLLLARRGFEAARANSTLRFIPDEGGSSLG